MSTPYEVPGIGTVTAHESGHYIVSMLDGRVCGFPAPGGNTIEANAAADIAAEIAVPTPLQFVPPVISRSEFVIAVRRELGITEGAIFALISGLPAGEQQETARDLWENAREFKRSNSLLNGLAALSDPPITQEQLDEVFRVGAALDLD